MEVSLQISYSDDTGKRYAHTLDYDFDQMREVLFESFKDPGLAVAEAIRDTESSRRSHERTRQMFITLGRPPVKTCPMCAELIPGEAKKCSHCHELLEKP